MERLWAPWRMEFIRSAKDGICFMCAARDASRSSDRENLLLYRGSHAMVIMNRYPYNNGHLLICPNRHEGHFPSLKAEELAQIDELAKKSVEILGESMRAEGFNLGYNIGAVAGAGVKDHIHLHIVPRWGADTNFMPVIADVHVVPQALLELYDRLKLLFDAVRIGGE